MEGTLSTKALRHVGAWQVGKKARRPVLAGAQGQEKRSEGCRAHRGGKRCRGHSWGPPSCSRDAEEVVQSPLLSSLRANQVQAELSFSHRAYCWERTPAGLLPTVHPPWLMGTGTRKSSFHSSLLILNLHPPWPCTPHKTTNEGLPSFSRGQLLPSGTPQAWVQSQPSGG